jgi:hypothetical protein
MTQTRPTYNPISIFEERVHAAQTGAVNMASFIAASSAIKELMLYEAEMTDLGGGAPDIYACAEINMKWSTMSSFSLGDA